MKVMALCWVKHNGWYRAGEVFEAEDPSALTGIAVAVNDSDTTAKPVRAADAEMPTKPRRGRKA